MSRLFEFELELEPHANTKINMPKPQHISRYDFVDGLQSDETGTIGELCDEIDAENRPASPKKAVLTKDDIELLKKARETAAGGYDKLKTIRNRLKECINRTITTRTTEQIPLTELKTIYLLYRCNDDNDIELFGRLEPPHLSKPSLEFRTEGDALGNESYIPIFDHLKTELRKEIAKDRLDRIHEHIPTRDDMLHEIEIRNVLIINTLREWLQGDSSAITAAYKELTKAIDEFSLPDTPATNPLHEALYTHIQALPFQHHVYGFKEAIEKACSKIKVNRVKPDLIRFCKDLGKDIHPLLSKVTSVNGFEAFASEYRQDLKKLVEKVTRIKTNGRNFNNSIEPARRILSILVNHHFHEDNNTYTLSPLDCLAALCTSRFQVGRDTTGKIKHKPYWTGQVSQGSNLVQHLHTDRSIEDLYHEDFIPHSVLQILYHRFGFISSALMYGKGRHEAYMDFQIARLKKHAEILRSNDVDAIIQSLSHLEFHIQTSLMKFNPSFQFPPLSHTAINEWLKDGH